MTNNFTFDICLYGRDSLLNQKKLSVVFGIFLNLKLNTSLAGKRYEN